MTDLAAFLDRRDPEGTERIDGVAARAADWTTRMEATHELHPITRACLGMHLWPVTGLDGADDVLEMAVTAARIAASEGQGAVFAPLAMGGAADLRAAGSSSERLLAWLAGMECAIRAAMRHLGDIEAWSLRAEATMAGLSGRTPPRLRAVLAA